MKITPLDIKKQEFGKSLRGFDTVEVQSFLEMVSEEFENALKLKEEMERENRRLQNHLKEYQEIEKTLKSTLMEAQQSTDKTKKSIEKEAELIIKEAEIKAEEILENARKEANKIQDQIFLLKNQRESFVLRLKQLLRSQLELIKVLEIEDVKFKSKTKSKKVESKKDKAKTETEQVNVKEKEKEKEKKIIDPMEDMEEEKPDESAQKDSDLNIIDRMIFDEDEDENNDEINLES